MTSYQLANSAVLREEDKIVFDSNTFTVHKLNESALEIVQYIDASNIVAQCEIEEWAKDSGFDLDDIDEFLSLACAAGFIEKLPVKIEATQNLLTKSAS